MNRTYKFTCQKLYLIPVEWKDVTDCIGRRPPKPDSQAGIWRIQTITHLQDRICLEE